MKERFKFEAGAYFMTNALRQLGYTNYTAIAGIIDNSLEREVGSKNIFIDLVRSPEDKSTVSEIIISDDGCGMDYETLREAMRLGSRTGKDNQYNLGVYGAGLKTAAISIGRKLCVYTKTDNGSLLKSVLDIDSINEEEDTIDVTIDTIEHGTEEHYFFTNKVGDNHGTVIQISKLDRLQNKDYYGFEGTLSRKVRIIFNKFIESDDCAFYVNGKKLEFFDAVGKTIGTESLDGGEFTHENSLIKWKAWYVPKSVQEVDFNNYFGRTNQDAGIYIYRQMRLVGHGLDLGLAHKNWHEGAIGFRFELFMDGTADKLFGTTFTKMVTEKDKAGMDQSFYDKLSTIITPLVRQCVNAQRKENNEEKVPEEINKTLERTTETLNKNAFLANTVQQRGKNEKPGDSKPKNPDPKPQEHPCKTRKRKGEWLAGFKFVADGPTGFMYEIEKRDGRAVVLINQDHAFYENIFKHLDAKGQNNMAIYLACEYSAMSNSDYYINEDAERYIKSYKDCYGDAVRRAFIL